MDAKATLDDGYTRIANTLLDAILGLDLTKRQQTVLLAIIRKTYGYNKSEDDIGLSQLAELTKIHKPHVSQAVTDLVNMNIVIRSSGDFGHVLKVNKKYKEWTPKITNSVTLSVTKTVTPKVTNSVTVTDSVTVTKTVTEGLPNRSSWGYQIGQAGVTELVTTKDKPTKDKPTKDNSKRLRVAAGSLTTPAATPEKLAALAVWSAYSEAYRRRYGVDPIRNAKVNGQIAQFVKRIPHAEAPAIAGFYLTVSKSWYVSKGHDVGSMLNDAEALRTQWATGRRVTNTQAQQADQTQSNGQVFLDMISQAEEAARHA